MEPKNERSLSKFLTSEPQEKMNITQLLLSLSIFSLVFSYLCSSNSLFHSHKLPANPINLHSHALNKTYIFLICNALLVILSKTSGLVRSSSGFDLNDMLQKRVGDGILLQTDNNSATKEPASLQRQKEDGRILNGDRKDQVSLESDGDDSFEADADEFHEKESENCLPVDDIIEEDGFMDEQEVAEEETLSTEELNKKFEEFIRKTKEEIMFNEARQLVIVK